MKSGDAFRGHSDFATASCWFRSGLITSNCIGYDFAIPTSIARCQIDGGEHVWLGGMIAYVVDADAVAKAAGPKRSGKLKIGKEDHRVSRHHVNNKAPGKAIRQEVEVVHFALEIDANPPETSMQAPACGCGITGD